MLKETQVGVAQLLPGGRVSFQLRAAAGSVIGDNAGELPLQDFLKLAGKLDGELRNVGDVVHVLASVDVPDFSGPSRVINGKRVDQMSMDELDAALKSIDQRFVGLDQKHGGAR